jgi:hypothetical protein
MANSMRIHSPSCCKDLPITIGDEPFTLDCFGLALGLYEMVLRVQWLESLRPIQWNFTARTVVLVQNGHRVCWQAPELTGGTPPLMFINEVVLEDLLHRFYSMFCRPCVHTATKSSSYRVQHQ